MQNSNTSAYVVVSATKQSISGSATFSDEKLFELCRKYGAEARLWKQKFMGLLPEVNRRQLFRKKGFGSIFEFAAKLAGMSHKQVQRVLNIDRSLEDKPVLRQTLESGEVSVNKLARVVSIATVENQEVLSEQVKLLSHTALETLVRDERHAKTEIKNGFLVPLFADKSVRAHTFEELQLSGEVCEKLADLKRKGIDINELVLKMLDEREEKIEKKKDEILEKMNRKAVMKEKAANGGGVAPSRYMAVEIRRVLKEEHGTKCSIQTCWREAENIHHAQRFALSQNHDPHFLAPLCREHHLIAHSIDLKFQEKRKNAVGEKI